MNRRALLFLQSAEFVENTRHLEFSVQQRGHGAVRTGPIGVFRPQFGHAGIFSVKLHTQRRGILPFCTIVAQTAAFDVSAVSRPDLGAPAA